MGTLNWLPITPRDASLSDSRREFFQSDIKPVLRSHNHRELTPFPKDDFIKDDKITLAYQNTFGYVSAHEDSNYQVILSEKFLSVSVFSENIFNTLGIKSALKTTNRFSWSLESC